MIFISVNKLSPPPSSFYTHMHPLYIFVVFDRSPTEYGKWVRWESNSLMNLKCYFIVLRIIYYAKIIQFSTVFISGSIFYCRAIYYYEFIPISWMLRYRMTEPLSKAIPLFHLRKRHLKRMNKKTKQKSCMNSMSAHAPDHIMLVLVYNWSTRNKKHRY